MAKAKNTEKTSPRVATIASKLLRTKSTPKAVKSVAASVLTQTPNKSSGKKGGKRK